jgi:hypothetical protein
MIAKIILDKDNRMLRCGFGKNAGAWFGRFDFWWIGVRFTGSMLPFYFIVHLVFAGLIYWAVK